MLYGLSRNLCQNSAKIVRTVQKYTQKYITAVTSISVPTNVVWQPWNACQYSQKLQLLSSSISVHITCCMTSTNPYGTACSSLLSEIRTSLCFGMRSLLRQMLSLFSAQPLSCSLLFSQQECCNFLVLSPRISLKNLLASHQEPLGSLNKISSASSSLLLASHQEPLGISPRFCSLGNFFLLLLASHQEPLGISPRVSSPRVSCSSQQDSSQEWVRPLALINLMREGEEFSNLTAEIRLDGWLRFGVSSLTLTLIIKLSFNLHLTN
jgi:hypothetical protein